MCPTFASSVLSKIVLKLGFLERDFERDHLAEKKPLEKNGPKNTLCIPCVKIFRTVIS
jgi:hypothetical protein